MIPDASALSFFEGVEKRKRELAEKLSVYRNNPAEYLIDRLGFKRESIYWSELPEYANHKWDGDKDPLLKLCNNFRDRRRTAVMSATGTGKTYVLAGLSCWHYECIENSITATVAPTEKQLHRNIWQWIPRFWKRINLGDCNDLLLRNGGYSWSVQGIGIGVQSESEMAERIAGLHAPDMCFVLEETPGIITKIINTVFTTCIAPRNFIIAVGNPNSVQDNLSKIAKREDFDVIRISALDHPNIVCDNAEIVPGAQSRQGLKSIDITFGGPDHPLAQSRKRGIVPMQNSFALIQYQWCMDAVERGTVIKWDSEDIKTKRRALGVDVARSEAGDLGAIARGSGEHCKEVVSFPCPDPNALGDNLFLEIEAEGIDPSYVAIDSVGVGGETVGTLKGKGKYVIGIFGGEAMHDTGGQQIFENLRCQMWWQAREDLRLGNITMPYNEDLITQLTTPLWEAKAGKIWVESKLEYKKRLGRSPDEADAFVNWNWIRQEGGGFNIGIISDKPTKTDADAGWVKLS